MLTVISEKVAAFCFEYNFISHWIISKYRSGKGAHVCNSSYLGCGD
jgi:hypothetical protein